VADRKGTGIDGLSESECRWSSKTEKAGYGAPARRFADAIAFEIECRQEDRLQFSLTCDQLEQNIRLSPNDILRTSTLRYMESIPATNDGAYWHNMETCAKSKIHQGWSKDQLTASLTCEDDGPADGPKRTDFYYVRLVQRNGQRAWSSPIWVEQV
jgi:hypothetical protein